MTTPLTLSNLLTNKILIAFDTETTGMWAPFNRIVELAAVKFDIPGNDLGTFQSLVNPGRSIPDEVTRIHGITDAMVEDSPPVKSVLEEFISFCGSESILVAHNAPFDISFIGSELNRAGLEFGPNPILDTVDIYHRFFPGLTSYSLLNLVQHFGLAQSQEHRALSDALLVKQLVIEAAAKTAELDGADEIERILTVHRMSAWQAEPARLPDQFADIEQAIAERSKVEIEYNHPVKASATRTIHPQQVFRLGTIFYINAYCELAGGERTFRLDRILRYRVLPD